MAAPGNQDTGTCNPNPGIILRPALGMEPAEIPRISLDLFGRQKFHGNGVDAVAGVGGGEAFSHEDVAQVASTVGALHLDPHAVGVGQIGSRPLGTSLSKAGHPQRASNLSSDR